MVIWKEFHDFWVKSKIPCHIIRYEDILQRNEETLTELFKFILNERDLTGTVIQQYVKMNSREQAP